MLLSRLIDWSINYFWFDFVHFEAVEMFKWPKGPWTKKLVWLALWPGNLVLFLTVPDVRRGGKWRRVYLFSFLVCVCWIGILSYLVTWFITVIGNTRFIPVNIHFNHNTHQNIPTSLLSFLLLLDSYKFLWCILIITCWLLVYRYRWNSIDFYQFVRMAEDYQNTLRFYCTLVMK